MKPPTVVQSGNPFVLFTEVVSDTDAAKVYRIRAGKWPKVLWVDERRFYPPRQPELRDTLVWKHGDASFVVSLTEDGHADHGCGLVEFYDDDEWCEWLVTTHKRCVWVVLVRNAPPRFTGME
jgi:hypothetical protein